MGTLRRSITGHDSLVIKGESITRCTLKMIYLHHTFSYCNTRTISIKSRSTDRPNRAPHNGHGGKDGCELDV